MRQLLALLCAVVLFSPGCGQQGHKVFDFETDDVNALAKSWSSHHWGEGAADWKVIEVDSNHVLAQLQSENPKAHFNIAVYDEIKAANVELTVRFKAIKGTLDQGGGFVWRYLDENNHYIVRANPLENNVVLYKMEKGVRSNLPIEGKDSTYGVDVNPLGNTWHTLGLRADSTLFQVFLDDSKLFQVTDSTFTSVGKIGLWTKADAVTYFDDLHFICR